MSVMSEADKKKIYFEEADRPPPDYYTNTTEQTPLRKLPFQTPDPSEWLKAPEFVPRSRLAEAFEPEPHQEENGYGNVHEEPYIPFDSPSHVYPHALPNYPAFAPFSMGPSLGQMGPSVINGQGPLAGPSLPQGMGFIPNGYSANITHINAGIGAPIPAIVLRKKRRKRNRQTTNSMALNSSESPCSSHPVDPNGENSQSSSPERKINDQDSTIRENQKVLGGSCPDLSEEQLQLWDDYLFETTVGKTGNQKETERAGYEVVPRRLLDIAEQEVDGISNPIIRKLDQEMNGNSMTSSMVLKRLSNSKKRADAPGSTEKSLASELDQLSFRPELTKYGYPQIDASSVQMATFHHDNVQSSIVPRNFLSDSDEERFEEDCFEGINITVNAFDACDDLTLSDVENGQSRFEQIQQALLKRNSIKNFELEPPERVCCSLM